MRAFGRIPHTRFRIRQRLLNVIAALLTKPRRSYEQRLPNDLDAWRRTLRKCDVLLIEGDQRVSQLICYLTKSSWSHVAIYVGDALLHGDPEMAEELRARFGDEAAHLLVEAIDAGVVATPLSKYERYNLRLCRPNGLRKADVAEVLAEVTRRLGHKYDMKHILDLGRHFFPIALMPARWRRRDYLFGRGIEDEVICSCMIAKAFARVGYPILPQGTVESVAGDTGLWGRVRLRRRQRFVARFREQHSSLITPRDFDLSPYFEVLKLNHFADPYFSYRDIVWEETEPSSAAAATAERAA